MKGMFKMIIAVAVGLAMGAWLHRCQRQETDALHGRGDPEVRVEHDTVMCLSPQELDTRLTGYRTYRLGHYLHEDRGVVPADRVSAGTVGDSTVTEAGSTEAISPNLEDCHELTDTMETVELPMLQRHYADSTWEVWVSGPVDPRLDSVRVTVPRITTTYTRWKPPKRWHIGPAVGIGVDRQGHLTPWAGVTVTYSIISF